MHAAAFVLCPQGSSTGNGRFAWSGSRAIASGIELGLAALREKYGAYVAAAPPLYAGFSQGASLARPVLRAGPVPFSGVVLAEGAYDTLADPSFPSELRARGTTHVLLVCGNPGCFERARRAELALRKAGLHAIAAGDPRAGHNLNREMQVALQAAWPAFVEGLPGWAASGLLRAR
jgi:predicted esterase